MRRKGILSFLLAVMSVVALSAQSIDTIPVVRAIVASDNITLDIPTALQSTLVVNGQPEKPADTAAADTEQTPASARQNVRVGYRIQVFDDNNVQTAKHQAQVRRQQMESQFPEFKTYVQFNSPYWKVKVGDFRTRSEAEAALTAIRSAFPVLASQLRIVRDRINH